MRMLPALLLLAACAPKDAETFASGVFEATETIVSSESSGRLLEFSIVEGQDVAAGASIGKVDCRQLELQRAYLIARLGGLKTHVVDVKTQTESLKQQLAAAELDKARIDKLAAAGATTRQQVDDINARLAVLRSQESATKQSYTKGNQSVTDERVAMEVQRAELDDQIARCELKSPISGTVLSKYAERGEFTTPGKALYKLADTKNMFLRAYVTADQVTQMRVGQTVKVRADFGAQGSRDYEGRVVWVATKSEFTPKTILSRDERANLVYAVKIAVSNDGYLKIGMYGLIPLLHGASDVGNHGAAHR